MTHAQILTSHLGAALIASLLYLGWLLRGLSKRLGEVTRMRRYYRWFDVGNLLLMGALLGYLIKCSVALTQTPQALLNPDFSSHLFPIPLILGLAVNLAASIFYWGWLIRES